MTEVNIFRLNFYFGDKAQDVFVSDNNVCCVTSLFSDEFYRVIYHNIFFHSDKNSNNI